MLKIKVYMNFTEIFKKLNENKEIKRLRKLKILEEEIQRLEKHIQYKQWEVDDEKELLPNKKKLKRLKDKYNSLYAK